MVQDALPGQDCQHNRRLVVKPRPGQCRLAVPEASPPVLAPDPGDTVTAVALDCGFTRLSRFAGDCRRLYGEISSETNGKARSR
jgi:AraC-like DNA-binding protein